MKRLYELDDGPGSKSPKINRTHQELPNDAVFEVFSFLPSSFLVMNCSLVNKRWKQVYDTVKLSIETVCFGWPENLNKSTLDRITKLTIDMPVFDRASSLERFENLESIKFKESDVDSQVIQTISTMESIREIKFIECAVEWCILEPILNKGISIHIINRKKITYDIPSEDIIKMSLATNIKTLILPVYTVTDRVMEYSGNIINNPNISSISIPLTHKNPKLVPLMKNIESLVLDMSDTGQELPILNLGKLKVLYVHNYTPYPEHNKDWLDPILNQLETLYIPGALFNDGKMESTSNLKKLFLSSAGIFGHEAIQFIPKKLKRLELPAMNLSKGVFDDIRMMNTLTHLEIMSYIPASDGTKLVSIGDLCYKTNDTYHCYLTRLEELRIVWSKADSEALSVLKDMVYLRRLVFKTGSHDEDIDKRDIEHISNTPHLEELDIRGLEIVDDCSENFSRMKTLRSLFIRTFAEGVESMGGLRKLGLFQNILSLDTVIRISSMKNVRYLYLGPSVMEEEVLDILSEMNHLDFIFLDCIIKEKSFEYSAHQVLEERMRGSTHVIGW